MLESPQNLTRKTNKARLQSQFKTFSSCLYSLSMVQRDTTVITAENKELKLRLQALEQQSQLRDALSEKLKEEAQRLKIEANQIRPGAGNGNPFYGGLPPQYGQTQLHQNQTQHQQHHNQGVASGQAHPSYMDFNGRA